MAITTNDNRIRLESAAKNGTLGTQGTLNANQIKFDTAITTNNGNLEASPSFKWRAVVLRRGEIDEEWGAVQSVEVDGLTCNCYANWDSAPASGDTYDIAYKLEDVTTIDGCDFETDSRQWVMTKKLVIATLSAFAFLSVSHGQVLRLQDSGALDSAFELNDAARFHMGTLINDVAERGGVLIFTNDADDETVAEFNNGSVVKVYESALISARAPDGVTGLGITVGATASVEWARVQTQGMATPPFKYRVKRYKEVDDSYVISVQDVKAMPSNKGWLRDPMAETIMDEITSDDNATQVRILIEEAD